MNYEKKETNLFTHSFFEFESDGCYTKVNLGCLEVTHDFCDINDKYLINHFYSTNSHNTNSKIGNGWKLDIEQYIVIDNGEYYYIDGKNAVHHLKENNQGRYVDSTGSGIYMIKNNYQEYQIRDDNDNRLYFDDKGRLYDIKVNQSERMITYDSLGQIIKYKDKDRCEYIEFTYQNGLLHSMSLNNNGKSDYCIYYKYQNGDLKTAYYFQNNMLVNYHCFSYVNSKINMITNAIGNGIKIDYSEKLTIKRGNIDGYLNINEALSEETFLEKMYLDSITPIIETVESENYINDEIYLNSDIWVFNEISKDVEKYQDPLEMTELYNIYELVTFKYSGTFTDVTKNEKTYRYYKSKNGEISSEFEVKNGDLLTIKKNIGCSLMKEEKETPSINRTAIITQNVNRDYKWLSNDTMGMNNVFCNSNFRNYYEIKGKNSLHFVVSFYIMHNLNNPKYLKVLLTAKSRFEIETIERINLDPDCEGAWQYVELYITFSDLMENRIDGLKNLKMKIVSDTEGSYQVSDVRVRFSDRSFVIYNNESYEPKNLNQYDYFRLETATGEFTIYLNESDYISNQDIIKSLMNKEKAVDEFDFIYYGGKKRISGVKKIYCYNSLNSREFELVDFNSINIYTVNYASKNRIDSNYKIQGNTITTKNSNKLAKQVTEEFIKDGKLIYSIERNGLDIGKKQVNTYDLKGNLIQSLTSTEDAFNDKNEFLVGNKKSLLEYTYNKNGDIESVKNDLSFLSIKYNSSNLISSTNRNGIVEEYLYDKINRLTDLVSGDYSNHIEYKNSRVERIFGNGNEYRYTYENEDISKISIIGDDELELYSFKNDVSRRIITTKESDLERKIHYDSYGKVIEIFEKSDLGNATIFLTYQGEGDIISNSGCAYMNESQAISKVKSIYDEYTKRTIEPIYDDSNDDIGFTIKDNSGQVLVSVINESNEIRYNVGALNTISKIEYSIGNRPSKIEHLEANNTKNSKYSYEYEYDVYKERLKKRTSGNMIVEYDYEDYSGTSFLSTMPCKETIRIGSNELVTEYKYDSNGNIVDMLHTGMLYYGYIYEYDSIGRIKYESLSSHDDYSYVYNKFDRLEKVYKNGSVHKQFHYDEMGRLKKIYKDSVLLMEYGYNGLYPISIKRNGEIKNCEFKRNGKLISYNNIRYQYDITGIRISKDNNGLLTNYYYNQDRILGEDLGDGSQIRYVYDLNEIVGVKYYKGKTIKEYEYLKDNTGSVIAIVENKNVIAKYQYDVWGNVVYEYYDRNDTFGLINPIRYKSYYYDTETNYYYINGRYYDPFIGAFISPDSPSSLDVETIGGLNLYVYCCNNPVKYSCYINDLKVSKSNEMSQSIRNGNAPSYIKRINSNNKNKNVVIMTSYSNKIIKNELVGKYIGNVTSTVTISQNRSNRNIYCYYNIGDSYIDFGHVVKIKKGFEYSMNVSTNIGISSNIQLFSKSIGLGFGIEGLTLSLGHTEDEKTYELSVNIGWLSIIGFCFAPQISFPTITNMAMSYAVVIFFIKVFKK